MAITSIAGVVAGLQPSEDYVKNYAIATVANRYLSLAYALGSPAPAVANSSGMAGAALTSYAGQLLFPNGAAKQYLARFTHSASGDIGSLSIYDRLWHQSGIDVTSTSAQTINSAAWPARDLNQSTNGDGVRIALEVTSTTGAGASTISIEYTNQAGTATRAGTSRIAYVAASATGTWYDFMLDAGDTGVRSVQTYTSTVSMSSGTVNLVAYREIARVGILTFSSNVEFGIDAITGGMPEAYDDTVPFLLWLPRGTGAPGLMYGQVIWTHG